MRTVEAVTAPLDAAGPNALTQSPTARLVAAAACVAETVVLLVVVILRLSVLGVVGFLLLELEDFAVLPKLPGEMSNPVTDKVDPLTAVTLPLAMAMLPAPANPRPEPDLNVGRVPPVVPLPPRRKPPPNPPAPPAPGVPVPLPNVPVHEPVDEAVVTVMLRAAMVVFDDLEGVPVTVTQSPDVSALTVWLTVCEKAVEDVQLTAVCPLVGLCTSMVEPVMAATLPLAPRVEGAVAAPAAEARVVAATSATAPAPAYCAQRRLLLRLVGVSMSNIPLLSSLLFGS
jgi:hypothetical protein